MPDALILLPSSGSSPEQNEAIAPSRVHYPTGAPLDFSFQELTDLAGHNPTHPLLTTTPTTPYPRLTFTFRITLHAADLPTHEVNDSPNVNSASRHDPSGIRLSYNGLTNIDLLPSLLSPSSPLLTPYPSSPLHSLPLTSLHWLDLSSNHLTTIPSTLTSLPSLSTFYLHSNLLTSLTSLTHLLPLPHLTRLTLHGNPVTSPARGKARVGEVRLRVLGVMEGKEGSKVKELDFVGVTEREVQAALRLVHVKERRRVKRVKQVQLEDDEE